ncbi:MAG: hypothetical protein GY841_13385 [FCB group bacterium]|nr:hypothetical protein [FCB group bacterium]
MSLQIRNGFLPLVCGCVFIIAIMALTGCEGAKDPVTTTGSGDVNIQFGQPTASPSTLATSATTIVEVVVSDGNGAVIEGTVVTFSVTPNGSGSFSPASATTDADGIASTVFTPLQPGTLSIFAYVGSTYSSFVTVEVTGTGTATSGNLTMSITPSLLTADGSSEAIVVVKVADEDGTPAPDSTVVKLTAGERFEDLDGNGYFTINVDSLLFDFNANESWDPLGIIPAVAYTEAGSVAVDYMAGVDATTAYIKATVTGSGDFNGSLETSIQLTPDASIFQIELSADEAGIQVRHTGGIESTVAEAICYDVNGNTVPEGLEVIFVITNGPDGGENIAGMGYGPVVAYTNANGVAAVPIWSGTVSGTIRLRASASTVLSNATFITVYAGPPYNIAVGAQYCNLPAWELINEENIVTAVVSDLYSNPVQDSVTVYFNVDEGVIGAYGMTTDSSGVATVVFRTGAPWDDGDVWIWAETSGGTVACSSMFINSGPPASVTASVPAFTLLADGKQKYAFWVQVLDVNDNFVADQTLVKSKTIFGSATSGATSDGCHASVYEVEYNAPTLEQDFSYSGLPGATDDGIGATDYITVRSGFVSTTVTVTLTTSFAHSDKSSVKVGGTIPYNATGIPASCVIKDRYSNPLADHNLTATITAGTVTSATAMTNTFGEAFGFTFNAPATPPPDVDGNIPDTKAILTITDSDPRGTGLVLTASITFTEE